MAYDEIFRKSWHKISEKKFQIFGIRFSENNPKVLAYDFLKKKDIIWDKIKNWDKIKYFATQKRLDEYPDCTQPAGGEEDCLMLDIYQVCIIT